MRELWEDWKPLVSMFVTVVLTIAYVVFVWGW